MGKMLAVTLEKKRQGSEKAVAILTELQNDFLLSDTEIAALFEVTPMTIGRWRRGITPPSHYSLVALGRLLRAKRSSGKALETRRARREHKDQNGEEDAAKSLGNE